MAKRNNKQKKCKICGCFIGKNSHSCENIKEKQSKAHIGLKYSENHKKSIRKALIKRWENNDKAKNKLRKRMEKNQFARGNKPNKTAFKKKHIPYNKGIKNYHHSGTFKKSENHRLWDGGHPTYWRFQARKIMVREGFNLMNKVVHHVNENITDNRPENLRVLSRSEHAYLHALKRGRG